MARPRLSGEVIDDKATTSTRSCVMALSIDRLDHLVITARDVEATVAWYERALGTRRETFGDGKRLMLRWGNQRMNVRGLDDTQESWFTGRTVARLSRSLLHY
jgi:hypothetical protein